MRRPRSVATEEQVIERAVAAAVESAEALVASAAGVVVPQDAGEVKAGRGFTIPLLIPEEIESGDRRVVQNGALTMRDFPLPLMWQIKTSDGHDGSVVVGRIDSADYVPGRGILNGRGVFDSGPFGREAQRLVDQQMVRWVSADLDSFTASEEEDKDNKDGPARLSISAARLMGATMVPKPAFQQCTIEIDPISDGEISVIPDGVYDDSPVPAMDEALVAAALVASGIPVTPPSAWFADPKLQGPTALQITEDGRVFGHVAAWDVDHIGMAFGTRPPRSASNYAYFHTGVLRTTEGSEVPVGQLTLVGGHAPLSADATAAVKHYDDTNSAFADVHAGEDQFGIWVAGALRPGVTPEQIRSARACSPSGDWRPIRGRLEMVAVCQVNVPGFPIARAQVASGAIVALVAAGALPLAKARVAAEQSELTLRLRRVLDLEGDRTTASYAESMSTLGEFKRSALVAQAAEARAQVLSALGK